MTEITTERIERLKGQAPPGVDAEHWALTVGGMFKASTSPSAKLVGHILCCLIADADAREAGPISNDLLACLRSISRGDYYPERHFITSDDARAILARAGLGT